MGMCFDYPSVARQCGLSDRDLRDLETDVRSQYGSDEMLIELRLLRTLQAIREGAVTAADARREFQSGRATHGLPIGREAKAQPDGTCCDEETSGR